MIQRSASLLRTRIGVSLAFAINGLVYANWTSRLPRLQELYGIDNGETGFVLTSLALGALVAMPLAGFLIVRSGSRRLAIISTLVFVLSVPLMAYMPNYWALLAVVPLIGISTGVMDVAVNAQSVEVEKLWGKPITSSFHACFSGGMFVGAGSAAGFISLGLDLGPHLLTVSLISMLVSVYALRHFLQDRPGPVADAGGNSGSKFTFAIVLLGLASLCTMVGEGAMADWTPLYMTRVTGSPEVLAPLAQASFSGAMFLGRAFGDFGRSRLGSRTIVVSGAALALIGVSLAILIPLPGVAIAGFGLVGLGLSNIVPVVFSQASKVPGLRPGVGISSVSTIGYAAFLFGPPVIGFVSDFQSSRLPEGLPLLPGVEGLRVGLGVVALLMLVLVVITTFYLRVED
ncbi:MFS transporter [Neolewinella litorea]|uniref:MFS transporter n=1 Tax=Neolewinella litorea TaxID=2562452 RepID=A0A4S4NNP7_9BACT|nr:MFS transporter [Neolewinella litorea]THH41624.1 MFS transporter [Neolewinella litorea]